MSVRSHVKTVVLLVFVGVVVAMIVGQQLEQPIVFGFVVTGSMSPTLEPGDGFIAIPPSFAGDVEEGDVVTFDAQELEGGGLTTHRIVGETSEGYVTRGDANPFTDQDGPEPPVKDVQIVAVALQVNGEVVSIPHLGTVVMTMQGVLDAVFERLAAVPGVGSLMEGRVSSMLVGLGLLLLALSSLTGLLSSGRDGRSRSRSREGTLSAFLVLFVIILLITVPTTASMIIPSGTQELTIVSSRSPSEDPRVIQVGGSQEIDYTITNDGYVPRMVVIEPASDGVTVSETTISVSHGEEAATTVTVYAPDETGAYLRFLSERHYVQVLPPSILLSLHRIHPLVAVLAINAVIVLAITIIFVVTVGIRPIKLRSTKRDVSFIDTLRRRLR